MPTYLFESMRPASSSPPIKVIVISEDKVIDLNKWKYPRPGKKRK